MNPFCVSGVKQTQSGALDSSTSHITYSTNLSVTNKGFQTMHRIYFH